jgi:hypothetical protein
MSESMPNSIEELKAETGLSKVNLKKMFSYLFDLQKSGVTNMWGASSYLARDFDLGKAPASKVAVFWIRKYEEIKKAI